MTLSQIIFRIKTKLGWTTKGSALTWLELDGNFEALIDTINAINSAAAANVAPYDNAFPYQPAPPTTYVSYLGNIYSFISGSPSTGVVPVGNPTIWKLESTGSIGHVQNTDTSIGQGTAYESTMQQIFDVINSQVINITHAAFLTAASGGLLKPNRIYHFFTESLHYVKALSTSTWSPFAWTKVSVPDVANYGLYDTGATYGIGDRATWDLLVWNNTTGVNGATPPSLDPTNWTLENQFTAPYYLTRIVETKISFQGGSPVAYPSRDEFGNTFCQGASYIGEFLRKEFNEESGFSQILALNFAGKIRNNTLSNSIIKILDEIGSSGIIDGNDLRNSTIQLYTPATTVQGSLKNCTLHNVILDFPGGLNVLADIKNLTISMAGQTIRVKDDLIVNGGYLTLQGGNIPKDLTITSGSTIDVGSLGFNPMDLYGIYTLPDLTLTEELVGFDIYPEHPIKIKAASGVAQIKTHTAGGGIANDQFLLDGLSLSLNSDDEDYVIVVRCRVDSGGLKTVWRIIEVSIAV